MHSQPRSIKFVSASLRANCSSAHRKTGLTVETTGSSCSTHFSKHCISDWIRAGCSVLCFCISPRQLHFAAVTWKLFSGNLKKNVHVCLIVLWWIKLLLLVNLHAKRWCRVSICINKIKDTGALDHQFHYFVYTSLYICFGRETWIDIPSYLGRRWNGPRRMM